MWLVAVSKNVFGTAMQLMHVAGGSGCSSTFRPKPDKAVADGGDGGPGGDVIIQADSRYSSWPCMYVLRVSIMCYVHPSTPATCT